MLNTKKAAEISNHYQNIIIQNIISYKNRFKIEINEQGKGNKNANE